jgi:hypothetical protein
MEELSRDKANNEFPHMFGNKLEAKPREAILQKRRLFIIPPIGKKKSLNYF